jgi:TRAP-type transport system periplasmic protein
LMLLAMSPAVFAAETIKLKYGQYFATTHKNAALTAQFSEEIKKRTNGRVEVTHYPGGTLTTAPKMFQAVVTDICDIGFGAIAYNQGRFPVLEAADLPLGRSDGWVASQVADDFYRKFTPKEWDSVHALFFSASGPNVVYTTKTAVRKLEDMKGVKLRGIGKMADTLRALGASPMPLDIVDLYEGVRRGVLEGAMLPLETLKGFKIGELAKYVTASWKVGATNTFYAIMNKEKWNSLPPDIKKIIDEVSMEFKEKHAMAWNDLDLEGGAFFKQNGGQIFQLSDAEAQRWQKAVEPVIVNYKKDVLAKGFKAEEVDAWISYLKERVLYWEKRSKEQHIQSPFE